MLWSNVSPEELRLTWSQQTLGTLKEINRKHRNWHALFLAADVYVGLQFIFINIQKKIIFICIL